MKKKHCHDKSYAEFVPHPRYGQGPLFSGLDPDPYDPLVNLHPNATDLEEIREKYRKMTGENFPWANGFAGQPKQRIPGTAIKADLSRQLPATVPVTHYYDVKCACKDCGRPFIFHAKEQQHWYEDLQFPLHVDCVRCPLCRETLREIDRLRTLYERLLPKQDRSLEETEQLLEATLILVEHRIFSPRRIELARALIKPLPDDRQAAFRERILTLEETIQIGTRHKALGTSEKLDTKAQSGKGTE